jgi:hypothetical protein
VGRNDDHGLTDVDLCSHSTHHSLILFESDPPTDTYYVAVSGYGAGQYGDFVLVLATIEDDDPPPSTPSPTPPPECPLNGATWINYHQDGMIIAGTTSGAPSNLPGTCAAGNRSPTVWYKFSTDFEGIIVVSTCSEDTTFDSVVTVFRAGPEGGCNAFCVGTNDDHGLTDIEMCAPSERHSAMGFESEPPIDTYYIAVSGFDTTQYGQFELLVIPIPPDNPTNPTLPPVSPTNPTLPPVSPTNPTLPPVSPPDTTIGEAELTIDIEPVFGPFVSELHKKIVQVGSANFFRTMLDNDEEQVLQVDLLESELLEADDTNFTAASKLRVDLRVTGTYDGQEAFQTVLEEFVSDRPDLYADSLRAAESSAGNRGYFSSVDTVVVADTQPPDTTPPVPPTPPTDPDAGSNNGGLIGGVVAGILVLAILIAGGAWYANTRKSPNPSDAPDAKKDEYSAEDTRNNEHSHTLDSHGDTMIDEPVSIVFVANGMKTSPDTKVGINLARCQDKDAIFLSRITETSIFAGQGLRKGMIIKTINGVPVKKIEQASSIIREYEGMLTIEAELQQAPPLSMFDDTL